MSKTLGGWIHSFTVTDTVTHKKGYTIYKITSIVFPRSVPEALTCITVWKRFNEIKKLYRDLSKRHKSFQLRGHLPEPKDVNKFFKRFDPHLIQARKTYILQLLDFAAQHPALYKSHSFVNFFENGHTPNTSPIHQQYFKQYQQQQLQRSNIESICDNLDLTYNNEISLIDPTKDEENDGSLNSNLEKTLTETNEKADDTDFVDGPTEILNSSIDSKETNDGSIKNRALHPMISFDGSDTSDYIYEAAFDFSQAVQAEVNQEYQVAYNKYKSGVDKLLTGSKDDTNDERKFIAKAKVEKYMNRAEELYEKYLLNIEDNKKTFQLSVDITDSSKEVYLERPWNQLSKFKVLQIIDTVMQVQDVTDKSIYIMKAIEKPSNNSIRYGKTGIPIAPQLIFLPQDVPYMVQLLGFFQSDSTIYLLLRQAKGGKLFDYIRDYKPTGHIAKSLNEIFTEITDKDIKLTTNSKDKIDNMAKNRLSKETNPTPDSSAEDLQIQNYDTGFLKLLTEYKNLNKSSENISEVLTADNERLEEFSNQSETSLIKTEENLQQDFIPSFDILSEDMDVNDLVSCSQKLLRSVSNTLEQFKETKVNSNEILKQIQHKIIENDHLDENNLQKNTKILEVAKRNSIQSNSRINYFKRIVLPEVSIKQWAKELVTAIDSLHQKGVILGDLRPDNLLLGSKGQLLLSYFYQNEGADVSTKNCINFIATEMLYVAPERPLTIKSDWWSFGVILFELLTGYIFKLCHPGNLSCYFELQYPDDVEISDEAKNLLNDLLQYNPENRIGINCIKMHKFFEGTSWDDIAKRGINLS